MAHDYAHEGACSQCLRHSIQRMKKQPCRHVIKDKHSRHEEESVCILYQTGQEANGEFVKSHWHKYPLVPHPQPVYKDINKHVTSKH